MAMRQLREEYEMRDFDSKIQGTGDEEPPRQVNHTRRSADVSDVMTMRELREEHFDLVNGFSPDAKTSEKSVSWRRPPDNYPEQREPDGRMGFS
ncbi:1380_t:CDS:2 [Funneliformis caledonium]|uniref:1380_t:CDS:1 n=1 Tax=Funneliformis caledonium TaxID=1117310 RepID=A0A9N8YZR3_9GLOM|nr:1380_t:CDS:2 [Funneliformis caledonium]